MKMFINPLVVTVVFLPLCIGAFTGVEATEEADKVNVEESAKNKPDDNITYLTVSAELATIARDKKDSVLMLAAARLEAMAATKAETKDKTTEGEAKTEDKEKTEKAALYALAEEYAGSNESLLALIGDSKKGAESMRGRRPGPARHRDTVGVGRTDVYWETFAGGKYAEVSVVGDGDTDLDLYIYDENGNLICRDTGYGDWPSCHWWPQWTGQFRIRIENLGRVYNNYTLYTN